MHFNLNSFLIAVSTALDYAEREIMHITVHHSKRVSYIALRLAEELGMDEYDRFDLCSYALMHDSGITEAFLNQNWLEPGHYKNLLLMEHIVEHCGIGEAYVRDFPFLGDNNHVIMYHHEHYDGSGFYGKAGDEIPLMAQLIGFGDALDIRFDLCKVTVGEVPQIAAFVNENTGRFFSPLVARAFTALSTQMSFWNALRDEYIIEVLEARLPQIDIMIDDETALKITSVFSRIIDSKSHFTAKHSSELMDKARRIAESLGFERERALRFQMAANLHDIGKLATPTAILEKASELSRDEFETIKEHVKYTYEILKNIKGFETVHQWASGHHERADGSGYPLGLKCDEIADESLMLATLDMYQALREERPYRKAMPHSEAIEILVAQSNAGKLMAEHVNVINRVFAQSA